MNDESNLSTSADEDAVSTNDPNLPPTQEGAAGESYPPGDLPHTEDAPPDPDSEMLADPDADPDFDRQGADTAPAENGLDELRGELKALQNALRERDERLLRLERIDHDFNEFAQLYPNVAISQLSDEVWRSVEKGNSLAAAYALAERRQALLQKQAQQANESNRARSAGALHNAESLEYSPAEVRAMSAREVRENLPKIMRSMQKWK